MSTPPGVTTLRPPSSRPQKSSVRSFDDCPRMLVCVMNPTFARCAINAREEEAHDCVVVQVKRKKAGALRERLFDT